MSSNALNFDSLLKQIPVGDIASHFGIDQSTAQDAVTKALPGLLGGLAVNAQSEKGASALAQALQEHVGDVPALAQVDTSDGKKIVKHALGDKQAAVATALGGGSSNLISDLMPMLAPMVMAYLAKNVFGGGTQGSAAPSAGSGGLGDILGSILGSSPAAQSGGGGGLGDILGSVLGGGAQKSGGGLGGILGSFLGGK